MPVVVEKPTSARTSPDGTSDVLLSRVTPRAFTLGLLLAALLCAVLPYNDYYVGATYLSGNFFPISALAGLLLLVLAVNPLLIACRQRHRLWTPPEIMTVWTMLLVIAGIPSSGLMRYLIPHLAAPYYYASPTNGWQGLILAHVPSRLLVTDPGAVKAFFEGLPRGAASPWGAWVTPLAWWSLFVGFLFLGFFCLSALFRRQWAEIEKFSFPLVQLPILLAEAPGPDRSFNTLLRSPVLWVAMGLVTCLHTVKGIHLFYPVVPDIQTVWHTEDYLTVRPWSVINDIQFAIYPLVIGFAYLLSSEMCLSMWLFYLVFKGEILWGGLHAWDLSTTGVGFCMGPAFANYQEVGATLMVTAWVLYAMRAHLRTVWRKAVFGDPSVDDAREPLSYRFAFFGAIAAYLGLFGWLTGVAGIQPLMVAGVLAGSFVVFVVLSWLVAQSGLLFVTTTFVPSQIMTVFAGTTPFNASSLALGAFAEHIGWQDAREFMMPSLLNAAQGAAATRLDARSLTRALAVCVVMATVIATASSIWLPYTHGGGTALKNPYMYIASPQTPFAWATSKAHNPQGPDFAGMTQILGGALFALTLLLCRTYLPWFGIHPAGFMVAGSWAMYMLWFSLFLGWLIKAPVMRYGGIRLYRLLLPFFLGLILGDCLNAMAWTVIGLLTGTGYNLLPN
jgi:hypothetical protein